MKNIELNKSVILFLYNKHKNYIVPVVTIIVSLVLLLTFTIPQIEELSTRQQEVKYEKDKLTSLVQTNGVLSNLNDSKLNTQLTIASEALPSTKNFSGVLSEISFAANKTGIFLGDFDFQVGDISNPSTPAKGFPNLQLTLSVSGDASSVANFINELYKSLPLVEVTKIQIAGNHAQVNTLFYYKPYAERPIDSSVSLSPLTKNDIETLDKISSWNNSAFFGELQLKSPNASSSASSSAF